MNSKKEICKAVILTIAVMILLRLIRYVLGMFILDSFLLNLVLQFLFASAAVLASYGIMHYRKVLRSHAKGFGSGLGALGLCIALTSYSLFSFWVMEPYDITESSSHIIMFVLRVLLIGIAEETLFRGMLQNTFHRCFGEDSRKHVILAIVCASTVFGLIHMMNMFSGVTLSSALAQSLQAIPLGMLLGAAYYRSGKNLWPGILVHAYIDFNGFLVTGGLSGISSAGSINSLTLSPAILVTYAIYLTAFFWVMRKKKIEPLLDHRF